MPSIPHEKVDTNSVKLLNSIRNEIGGVYASQIPEAYAVGDVIDGKKVTRDVALSRLREIGQAFRVFDSAQNAFLNTLVNRIGLVLLTNRLYENPWASFKRGILEYGETVEEIFVNILEARQFDPDTAENTVFKRALPDVQSAFHRLNYQKFYKVTISEQQLRAAFLSFEGVSDLIGKIIEQLYTSANFDEFLMMKYMIAKCIVDGNFYPITIPDISAANANSIVTSMKNVSEQVTFMSTQYNEAGVATYTDKDYQYLIMNTEFISTIDVEVLARAFNLEYTQFMGHTVSVNSFTLSGLEEERVLNLIYPEPATRPASLFTADQQTMLAGVPAVLIDANWMMIFDNLALMKQIENGEGLYWNYVYHNWKTFSHSPFNTAIAFTTVESAVTGVTVSPATATVNKGSQLQLTGTVATTGLATKGVTWSINSDVSSISPQGLLSVSATETAATITVTATSLYDPTKSGTATITVGNS